MAAGIQYSKAQLDSIAGGLSQQFKRLMEQAADFQSWLSAQTDADLTALGYSAEDISILRGGASDMATLVAIAEGQATQTTAQDFTANTKKLWGIGF